MIFLAGAEELVERRDAAGDSLSPVAAGPRHGAIMALVRAHGAVTGSWPWDNVKKERSRY